MKIYILKTYLLEDKKVSRKIEIKETANLYKLAETVVKAYNFDFDHCFGFFSNISEINYYNSEKQYELFTDLIEEGESLEPTGADSVKKTKIRDVWHKIEDKMLFLFDYGDNWQFVIELKSFDKENKNKKYPRIFNKVGKSPRQY